MGYSVYYSDKNKRWQGYGVPAYCDHPNCKKTIDRGMGYVCCDDQDHMYSCGGFYCAEHADLCTLISKDEFEDLEDYDVQEKLEEYGLTDLPIFDGDGYFYHCQHKPIEAKEHPNWLEHIEKDESWREWREESPDELKRMQELMK